MLTPKTSLQSELDLLPLYKLIGSFTATTANSIKIDLPLEYDDIFISMVNLGPFNTNYQTFTFTASTDNGVTYIGSTNYETTLHQNLGSAVGATEASAQVGGNIYGGNARLSLKFTNLIGAEYPSYDSTFCCKQGSAQIKAQIACGHIITTKRITTLLFTASQSQLTGNVSIYGTRRA